MSGFTNKIINTLTYPSAFVNAFLISKQMSQIQESSIVLSFIANKVFIKIVELSSTGNNNNEIN